MRTILIVDDHPIVLQVMTAIAQKAFPDASVNAIDSFAEAEKLVRSGDPLHLTLLDLGMPGWSGISALVRFRSIAPDVVTVVISANEEAAIVRGALDAGARGYIPKTAKPPVIASALHLVAEGGIYIPPQALSEMLSPGEVHGSRLTDRQREVLHLIGSGLTNKEVAKQLRISEDTVKQHAKVIYATLGISSRSQAVRVADRFGIKLD